MINIVSGLVFMVYPSLFFHLFFQDDVVGEVNSSKVLASILSLNLWSFILIMGFGYIWASQQAVKNRLFIFIGGLGKSVAALTWIVAYVRDAAKPLMLAGAGTDLLFGILFIGFFLSTRNAKA